MGSKKGGCTGQRKGVPSVLETGVLRGPGGYRNSPKVQNFALGALTQSTQSFGFECFWPIFFCIFAKILPKSAFLANLIWGQIFRRTSGQKSVATVQIEGPPQCALMSNCASYPCQWTPPPIYNPHQGRPNKWLGTDFWLPNPKNWFWENLILSRIENVHFDQKSGELGGFWIIFGFRFSSTIPPFESAEQQDLSRLSEWEDLVHSGFFQWWKRTLGFFPMPPNLEKIPQKNQRVRRMQNHQPQWIRNAPCLRISCAIKTTSFTHMRNF